MFGRKWHITCFIGSKDEMLHGKGIRHTTKRQKGEKQKNREHKPKPTPEWNEKQKNREREKIETNRNKRRREKKKLHILFHRFVALFPCYLFFSSLENSRYLSIYAVWEPLHVCALCSFSKSNETNTCHFHFFDWVFFVVAVWFANNIFVIFI